ncbi:MAG: DUF2142 domain-containing protein, partial [Acidimicrobiales bacterium]|nr:DUF2142 domain-containing protein [Acidimicrobiales bacterium]
MSAASPSRARGRWPVPRLVVAATVAFGALCTAWSVVAPLGEAPDETAHLALVWHLADGGDYPDFDDLQGQAGSFRLCATYASAIRACPRTGEVITPTGTRRHPVDEAPDKGSRPAWDDAGGAERVGPRNQMPQHPPAYYRAMAAVLQVERGVLGHPLSADRELALLRLVNVTLVLPLPFLAWWAARRFGASERSAAVASLVPLGVPMLSHIGSTLNNDNLFTLEVALATALVAGVVRGDRGTRTAVALGLVTALAFLTKGFAVVLPPVVVVAYLLGARDLEGWRPRLRAVAVPVAWAGGLTVALAGWWYVRVRSRTGRFAPSIEAERLTSDLQPPGFSPDVVAFGREFSARLVERAWGSFGWYSVRVPMWWALAASAVVVAAVAVALAPRRDPAGNGGWARLVVLAPLAALGAFPIARSWDLYVIT